MPWRCRGGDYDDEDSNKQSNSEVGKTVFQMAANSPVITKSPKRDTSGFDDINNCSNNNIQN